jgi:predicted PhzF superfamily epimerase YddE/YHI9
MTELHVLRVFLGVDGRGGNPLGVFLDGPSIEPARRQAVAAELGFSETVWVDEVDADRGAATIRIFTPRVEMPFAGHPTVGTSWLLRERGRGVGVLRVPAGDVATWQEGDLTWIRALAEWGVGLLEPREYPNAAAVDALQPGRLGDPGVYAWAWQDEAAGHVRVRSFPTHLGILEDEATGLGAVIMGDQLGRPLIIRQGIGSELYARPDPSTGFVDVGGRVELTEVREFVDRGATSSGRVPGADEAS